MKNLFIFIKLLVFTFFSGILITSCEFRESIVFNEDGDGKVTSSFYGDQLGDLLETLSEEGFKMENKEITMSEILEQNKESIDSLSDTQKHKLYALSDAKMKLENREGDLFVRVDKDFKTISEINHVIKESRRAINYMLDYTADNGFTITDENEEHVSFEDQLDIIYSWSDNIFERKTIIKDDALFKKASDEMKDLTSMGVSGFDYVLEYTFPYEVIDAEPSDVSLSLDRKTVILRRSLSKIMSNPSNLDIKVTLKK